MLEVGHRLYWFKKVGLFTWELKDGSGAVICRGKRAECCEALEERVREANGIRVPVSRRWR